MLSEIDSEIYPLIWSNFFGIHPTFTQVPPNPQVFPSFDFST